ncbi:hypothetical protein AOL_s00083g236 [Orbilia oligospora ATCC 24927]|uniref:Serine aminopeptidase S33 domain-containing protein n=1 Tax=Arthrobotrys oligospora (strain ATCC 24927 / CBS 115.81 / DSM 1491) TaxID=756982 RepID=G1XGV5_ARTOA|nr:hypothetical protein AOL_s00083g236 [Orbilia oligospora ATCC 24927]EGX47728.1 hypothetical protein AOL_s00083g236 [Orbilia oligospora ATCC 24927]
MATIATEETEIVLKDGHKLFAKEWKTPEAPVASVVFLHGFSDHCGAYYDLFPDLATQGINIYAFDQRGWGKSSLEKKHWGLTGGTADVLADLDEIITARLAWSESQPTRPPVFLVGHSAGGALTLTYAYSGSLRSTLAGFAAFSPFIALSPAEKPNSIVLMVGRLASRVMPNFQMLNKLDPNNVSRDPAVCKTFAEDKLCHDTGTLAGLSGMLERGARLLEAEYVKKFDKKKPVIVLHGNADKVTDFNASKQFFALLEAEDKEFKEYDGWYHKLHADLPENRKEFSGNIADWLLKRTDTIKKAEVPTANL